MSLPAQESIDNTKLETVVQTNEGTNDVDEQKKYDRQLRLWGVDAQKKMNNAKILLLGLNGIASETIKILALAGVNHITIIDNVELSNDRLDAYTNLFYGRESSPVYTSKEAEVIAKIGWLNPKATVNYEKAELSSKNGDYFKNFDLVCLSELMPLEEIYRINDECRQQNVKFYAQIAFGIFGFVFNDLGPLYKFSHEEFEQEPSSNCELIDDDDEVIHTLDDDIPVALESTTVDSDEENSDDSLVGNVKKKRRIESPKPKQQTNIAQTKSISKKDDPPERKKITKETSLNYIPFKDMINHESFNMSVNPALILAFAMYRFYDKYGRRPQDVSVDGLFVGTPDHVKFIEIINSILDHLKLDSRVMAKLSPDWEESLIGDWAAMTTIAGGISGQDILRAVSNKFIPIYNTYTFDGSNLRGTVDKIGYKLKK